MPGRLPAHRRRCQLESRRRRPLPSLSWAGEGRSSLPRLLWQSRPERWGALLRRCAWQASRQPARGGVRLLCPGAPFGSSAEYAIEPLVPQPLLSRDDGVESPCTRSHCEEWSWRAVFRERMVGLSVAEASLLPAGAPKGHPQQTVGPRPVPRPERGARPKMDLSPPGA